MENEKKMILGVTGGPGCGKSAVSAILNRSFGWLLIDADEICHEMYEKVDSALSGELCREWGFDIVTSSGTVDRKKLGERVFGNPEAPARLDAITHPVIRARICERIAAAPEASKIVLDVPLLFETGWSNLCRKTAAVWCPAAVQNARLTARGWSAAQIQARINAHFPAEKKLALADYGLITSGSMETLTEQCRLLDAAFDAAPLK